MDNDTWTRASALFDELYELPEADRISYLEKLARTDPELYRRLAEIMRFEKAGGGTFLGDEALSRYGDFIGDLVGQLEDPIPMEGRLIGSYRIVRQVGYGGMGAVYLAERSDGAFDRRVALKFIRTELQQTTLIDRFKREQRIQASLQHEAIPRLYDAGTDEHGTPYIVMDYVEGEPVTDYVRRKQLPLAKTLDLFARICDVIHFAHQNLIIHRDLKPSNIYITPDGEIKLLDFGIATLVDPDSGEGHARTGLNFFSLTYASPEQINGRPVSTATDTYALGVLLYVLLCGRVPYTTDDKTPAEIQQVICDDPVVPTSRKLEEEHAGDAVAGESMPRVPVTARQLRGDLDTIVLKALEKEPSRRYTSVQAMADDIRRYLNSEPIQARPPGYAYTFGKFLRR